MPKASSGNIRIQSSSDEQEDGHKERNNSLSAFNPMDPRLVLIDFEYASYNYRQANHNVNYYSNWFRGFDFANHFVEYSINYEVDQYPFYEILPEKFPNEKQMYEFMYSYEKELHPNMREDRLLETALNMVKVGNSILIKLF